MLSSPRMSTTRSLYPEEVPRSVTITSVAPKPCAFSTACPTSRGAMNWPFFIFTRARIRIPSSIPGPR